MTLDKRTLRGQMRSRAQGPHARTVKCDLESLGARVCMFFLPMEREPDMTAMMRQAILEGRTVCVPRLGVAQSAMEAVVVTDLERDTEPVVGVAGLRQAKGGLRSVEPSELDVVFVPGVAFDRRGGRLGHGEGYYDRFLARVGSGTRIIGVCFDHQIVDEVPMERHDVRMQALLTPSGLVGVIPPG